MRPEMKPDILELPIELRALVAYLNVDPKPSIILRASAKSSRSQWEALWHNEAFDEQAQPGAEEEDVLQALQCSQALVNNIDALHGRDLEGQRWHARIVGGRCIVVSANSIKCSDCSLRLHNALPKQKELYPNGRNARAETKRDGRHQLDWTQHEIPNMSSWIEFLRGYDWASTSIGPMESWSLLLRQYVVSIMSNPNPRLLVWGEDMTFIYNEACVQLFYRKHPNALGKHTSVAWAEAWPSIEPILEDAYKGIMQKVEKCPMFIERRGFVEETYWDFTMLPIFDNHGFAIACLDELHESTFLVTGERRRASMMALTEGLETATTLEDLWPAVLRTLDSADLDIPFALLYTVVDDLPEGDEALSESGSAASRPTARNKKCILAGTVGINEDHPDAVETFALSQHFEMAPRIVKSCLQSWRTSKAVILAADDGTLPQTLASPVDGRSWSDAVQRALVTPIKAADGGEILGILVTGLNPRCAWDGEYKLWIHLSVNVIEKAAALISLPEEQRRAQKIADDINNALTQQLRITTLEAEKRDAKFSRLASTSPTGMFMFDSEGRILFYNDTYLEMLGETRDSVAEKVPETHHWKDSVHEDDLERFIETWTELKRSKAPLTLEYRLKKRWSSTDKSTGQELEGETWLLATAFPEIEADGNISTVQGWLTDISHRKFSEKLLSQRLEDALENKRQTENFIDMTSHEMRNPLSAILQSADSIATTLTPVMPILDESMALSPRAAEEIVDAAQTIILCAQHQKRIVDDILTLSKLDASLLVISPDKVQTPALIAKALKMYEAEIDRAGIDVKLCIEPTYEELNVDWVVLDPSRLLQVIINLLTNSIKFTQYSEERRIKICLGASHQKPTGKHHGISFIPSRSRGARTPVPAIDIGEDIYLQIAVYDTGRGLSDDEMKLLFQRFQQASPKTYKQYGGSGLGLFISRELSELQGGQIGVSSKEGQTCFTFFVKAKRWLPENVQQPAQANLNNSFTSNAASPMAFSRRGSKVLQQATDQLVQSSMENGANCQSFEPISEQKSAGPEPVKQTKNNITKTSTAGAKTDMHVLIVEDNLINQKVMSQQLKRAGCTVHVANHGIECLSFLETSTFCAKDTHLDIVLLDLEMPEMDGLTCIKHVRQRQKDGAIKGHIPVIAVTANARSEQISQAIDAGMDQVVTKPFRIPELVPQMEALIAELRKVNST